ncbi:hypothetical protein pb186bvf_001182 [Paramecium bursaria]
MGAGQHRLYDSLHVIYEGIDTLPKELIQKLKSIHKPSNGVRKQYQSVIEKLRQTHCPPDLLEHRNTQICSLFHHYIITQTRTDTNPKLDLSKEKEFIKNFRLMNFDSLKKPSSEYLVGLFNLQQGLKLYCTMVNNILQSLVTPYLRLQLYTQLWEQYQLSMPKFDKNFSLLNKSFENIYGVLEPQLSIEILMAKIWGLTIQDNLYEFCKDKLLANRKLGIHDQYIADYFRSYVDMNIQIQNISSIGAQNIEDFDKFGNLIKALNEQSLEIYNCSKEDILNIYNSDIFYLRNILPEWIINNYCTPTIFDQIDQHIQCQVKENNCQNQEGKSNIMVSSYYKSEFNTLEDAIRKNSQVSGISTEGSQPSQMCSQYSGTYLEHLCNQYDNIKTNHKQIKINCENRANQQRIALNYFNIYNLREKVTDQMVANILQEIKNQPKPQLDNREIVLIQFTKF